MQCLLNSLEPIAIEPKLLKQDDLEINFKHTAVLKFEVADQITVTMFYEGEVSDTDLVYYGDKFPFGTKIYKNNEKLEPFTCYIMRSAESDDDYDPELTEHGKAQAESAAAHVKKLIQQISHLNLFVSDLQRSYWTLTTIFIQLKETYPELNNIRKVFLLPCIHEISYGKKNCDVLESRYSTKIKNIFELKNIPSLSSLMENIYSDKHILTSTYDDFYKSRFYGYNVRGSLFRNKRCRNVTMLGLIHDILYGDLKIQEQNRNQEIQTRASLINAYNWRRQTKTRAKQFEKDHINPNNNSEFKDDFNYEDADKDYRSKLPLAYHGIISKRKRRGGTKKRTRRRKTKKRR
jgi:hypothetical protein